MFFVLCISQQLPVWRDDDSGDDERLHNTNWQDSACVTFEREDLKASSHVELCVHNII